MIISIGMVRNINDKTLRLNKSIRTFTNSNIILSIIVKFVIFLF